MELDVWNKRKKVVFLLRLSFIVAFWYEFIIVHSFWWWKVFPALKSTNTIESACQTILHHIEKYYKWGKICFCFHPTRPFYTPPAATFIFILNVFEEKSFHNIQIQVIQNCALFRVNAFEWETALACTCTPIHNWMYNEIHFSYLVSVLCVLKPEMKFSREGVSDEHYFAKNRRRFPYTQSIHH